MAAPLPPHSVRRPVSVRRHRLCQYTSLRLDEADHIVLPFLPPWKIPTTTFITNWLQGKKPVVTEVELQHHFQAFVASLLASLHPYLFTQMVPRQVNVWVWYSGTMRALGFEGSQALSTVSV
ncbi:hypothetical protein E2C01_060556 [Portunus trituberculatus]|uniref:Uncharacterized protein n=1 Tax=Portunus trituberculatus TaxID=210409 RepID=A0A5B7H9D1_PORTR|nr:hypothetical protein [Portunus trituberculatus]